MADQGIFRAGLRGLRRRCLRMTAPILLTVWCFLAAAACASYTEEVAKIDQLYRGGQFSEAQTELEASELKTQERNRLLYSLERGMILDRKGDFKGARQSWLLADRYADELYTTSISKVAASFVYNDSITDYEGEDYEVVSIHTMLALSFLEQGQYKDARVEAVKINNKLAEINQRYEKGKNKYSRDAFALYLSGLIFEQLGELDDAIIDYRKSLDIYENEFQSFSDGGVPDSLVAGLGRLYHLRNRRSELENLRSRYGSVLRSHDPEELARQAQVVVIHDRGQIAKKTRSEFILPIADQVVRFSFPVINKKSYSGFGQTGVRIGGDGSAEKFHASENGVDLSAIAHQTLEDKRVRYTLKAGARLLAKGQVTYQAEKNFGLAGKLAGMVYSTFTETADTRSWSLLPGAINITRVYVKPGAYQVQDVTEGSKGKARKLTLQAGEMQIFRSK